MATLRSTHLREDSNILETTTPIIHHSSDSEGDEKSSISDEKKGGLGLQGGVNARRVLTTATNEDGSEYIAPENMLANG